jgi:hypothetical protein
VKRVRPLVSVVVLALLAIPGAAGATTRQRQSPAACRGTWEVVSSPNPGTRNTLYGTWGLSLLDAWAVGASDGNPLALHWDGVTWAEVAVPSPGDGSLRSVMGIAEDDVWAVGNFFDQGAYKTLVEHWDGLAWSIVSSPAAESPVTELDDVWAISPADVWAVGVVTPSSFQTLTLHWDGTAWSIVPSPNRGGANGDFLSGVTGSSGTDVWAVGFTDNGVDSDALILHWAGSTWDIVPQAPADNDLLKGAFALSSTKVLAVGVNGFPPNAQPLAERWDGTAWSTAPTQPMQGDFPTLVDVTALSARLAWAVGSSSGSNGNLAFIESLRGQRWRQQPIPHVTNDETLSAVTSVRGQQVWAVGWYDPPSQQSRTLILDYC